MQNPSWRVVLVNYCTGELAARAARAAVDALGPRGDVVVVDSASGDDSLALLSEIRGTRLLALPLNRGYGAGLNAGAADARCDYLLAMNADVLITPRIFDTFERRFRELATLAICAPRLCSPDGTAQPSCRLFPTHRSILRGRKSPLRARGSRRSGSYILPDPPSFTLCDVVAGACMAVRRNVWEELGGMDEEFFLYAEDTDFCRRAKTAGWLVGYEPSVSVAHAWGASTLTAGRRAAQWHARSLAHYFRKHYPGRRFANSLLAAALHVHARLQRTA